MDITLDVGSEISSLLQKLADQIGVTVAQIFPWYVQQAWLEGVLFVALLLSFWAVFIPLLIVGAKKADFNNGNAWVPVTIASGFVLTASLIFAAFETTRAITKIANPNFHAMKMLTKDIGKLRGGGGK